MKRFGIRATALALAVLVGLSPTASASIALGDELHGGTVSLAPGSELVEQVFSYQGLGQCAVTAGLGSDLPLLLGVTVVSAALVFGGNLIADLLYGVVDPKIRARVRAHGRKGGA